MNLQELQFRRGKQPHSPFEAMGLPEEEKERICRALLAEFGVTRVNVTTKGEMIHCCALPWHNESNPSASLNYKKLTYNCLGCGSKGGFLWFIATARGEDIDEARSWLGSETGTLGEEQSLTALLSYFDAVYASKAHESVPLPRMSPKVLEPWAFIHPYMTEIRGVPEVNLISLGVGYGILPIRLGPDTVIQSDRIVIPHWWKGDLVGWQSRRIGKDGSPKYQSTPDFPKDRTIYNYDPKRHAVVVESPLSVIASFDFCPIMEATFGASVTDRQVKLLAAHERVILWFDNDTAGWNATKDVGTVLEQYTQVFVVDSPWYEDSADLVAKGEEGRHEAGRLIADAVPFSLWSQPQRLKEYA